MKYMGSKARFANEILAITLKDRKKDQWYVEPFSGGMNIIDKVQGNRLANDCHYYLIEMWKALINNNWRPVKVDKELYQKVRDNKEKYEASFVGWVGFNCSYSGKWFGGFAGETKTKTGTVRDYQEEAIKNVSNQLDNLKGILLENKDYSNLSLPDNSIVYCDPPYEGTTAYADKFNHTIFWDWVRAVSAKGHSVYVSEYNAPQDFECLWSKEAKSSLSANGKVGGNKISIEKLFKYKNT
jgi:DNA adenine methylase